MKRDIIHSGLLSIVIVAAVIASNPSEIDYDSLAGYQVAGPPTVPTLKIIRDIDQWDGYCIETRCDTSLKSTPPDFTTRTAIGLLTMTGGGNRVTYRTLQHIIDAVDTVILEIKPDSQIFDPDMSIQAAYRVLLLAIPKTDKPIVLRESPITAIWSQSSRISGTGAPLFQNHVYLLNGRKITLARRISNGSVCIIPGSGPFHTLLSLPPQRSGATGGLQSRR